MKLWKVQKFAGDVVYDLRNRNLLLPVIALLIALVAVPVLISRGGSSGGAGAFGFGTTSAGTSPEAENAVVAYHPGIRNYKQRLKRLSAKDPFTQQYTSAPGGSSDSSGLDSLAQALGGGSTTDGTGVGGGSTGGGGTGGSGGGGKSPGKVKQTTNTTYYWWQADVEVGESGTTLATQNNVKPFQFLPTQDKPVLTYLGTVGGNQAVFLVSKDVVSVGGEGTCFPTVDACQLLGLNAGKGADLIYGPDGKTYHVQVLRLRRVTSTQPPGL
jgi:hypothetical protein